MFIIVLMLYLFAGICEDIWLQIKKQHGGKNKMRTKVRTTKRNINIINLVSTVILLYILGSFFEVNIHNRLDADPLENPYNVFSLLSQAMENN